MEREHISRETERERERAGGETESERVTPKCLDSTRESVELRPRPRATFLDRVVLFHVPLQLIGALFLASRIRLFTLVSSRGLRLRWRRVIMVLYAFTGLPPFSFLLREDRTPSPPPTVARFVFFSFLSFLVLRFVRAKRRRPPSGREAIFA